LIEKGIIVEDRIEQLLLEKFQDVEYQDFFIVDITFNPANKKLEVFLESDSILTIGQCAKLNRYLQNHIDENDWLGEKYILDVSSPGITKPLKLIRQYIKNIGRSVTVTLEDDTKENGDLIAVDDEKITLKQIVTIKEGKKKRKEEIEKTIVLDTIKKTLVDIKF
jgi:ribosome maturation factor RimP